MRTKIKRLLIARYCEHKLPAIVVKAGFWLFRLKEM